MLDVALVGTGGMMPLPNRFLASLLCRYNGSMLMVDCGEGAQVSLKMLGWGYKNIDCMCFTHFHADHISGLPGLLLAVGNSQRTEPLTLIGPIGLREVVKSLCVIAPELPFDMEFIELEQNNNNIIKKNGYIIKALSMNHGMPCFSYSFEIERIGKFDAKRAGALGLPREYWSLLQKGETVEYDGNVYTSSMVMGEGRKGIKVAYATDSRPVKDLPYFVKEADLFVCEGIYGEDEKIPKAIDHKHMVFSEAATIAKQGQVRQLWLTHFSPSLVNPEYFINNARDIFPDTVVGKDRMTMTLSFPEE